MDTIGLDLHKRESQLCMLTEEGEVIERRIVTSRERFTAVLGERRRARILLEASTESEWVARHLETPGTRGDRGGSQLRADVRHPQPPGEDRSARCAHAGGGVAGSAPTGRSIGRRRRSGMCARSWRCGTR